MSEMNDGVVQEEEQIEDSPALETDDQYTEDVDESDVDSNDDDQEFEEDENVEEDQDKVRMRGEIEQQKRIIELFQQTIPQQQQQVPVEPEYDPEDLATYGSVQEMVQREVGSVKQMQRESEIQQYKAEMIAKHPDYQQMYEAGTRLVKNSKDPEAMGQAIMNSANPPEMIYQLGLSQVTAQKPRSNNVAGRVKKNLSKPNTLSQAGGQRHSTEKKWSDAPTKEVEEEIRRRILGL